MPLGAAALQFPFGHPAVSSVIPGPNAPEQVRGNLGWMRVEIPADLWDDLKEHGLLAPGRADALRVDQFPVAHQDSGRIDLVRPVALASVAAQPRWTRSALASGGSRYSL